MTLLDGCFTGNKLDPIPAVCLVTTTEEMMSLQTSDLVGESKVVYVGSMLDVPGALRAGGPIVKDQWSTVTARMKERSETGHIIYISMCTVTTVDGDLGWQGKPNSALTGEQLCQAVWGAAFNAVRGERGNGHMILATLGKDDKGNPRPLAHGEEAPGNSLCSSSMPQVDILTHGIDLFITHGGQNSFVESITLQTPMLVVPTVGDQISNAEQAVQMGIGGKVSRPLPSALDAATVAAEYRLEVKEQILSLLTEKALYKSAVVQHISRYRGGGVDQAVTVLIDEIGSHSVA